MLLIYSMPSIMSPVNLLNEILLVFPIIKLLG